MHGKPGFIKGGTYFFTVVTFKRRKIFGDPIHVDYLRDVFRSVKLDHPFKIQAFVLLPDHFHCIVTLPPGDSDYMSRLRLVKSRFCTRYRSGIRNYKGAGGRCDEIPVWQGRYLKRVIHNEQDFEMHAGYIHWDPVGHGLASGPGEWKYSSFSNFVKNGFYDEDWGKDLKFSMFGLGWNPDKL